MQSVHYSDRSDSLTKWKCQTAHLSLKADLQYAQETGAKPRNFVRTQAKKCSSEKMFTMHAGVFKKFSCLCDFATHRADHHGQGAYVRPIVYHRIYNTSAPVRKKTKLCWHVKRKIALVFHFSSVALLLVLFFPLFSFSLFLQIAIAVKMIEKLRHMQYLDLKTRYEVQIEKSFLLAPFLSNSFLFSI